MAILQVREDVSWRTRYSMMQTRDKMVLQIYNLSLSNPGSAGSLTFFSKKCKAGAPGGVCRRDRTRCELARRTEEACPV